MDSLCDRCNQEACCFEIDVPDPHAFCGLVCQTAFRGQMQLIFSDCAQKLRRYRLLGELGLGREGIVFSCGTSRGEFALKVVKQSKSSVTEVLAASRLSRMTGFIDFYDYWICDTVPLGDPVLANAIQSRQSAKEKQPRNREEWNNRDLLDTMAHPPHCYMVMQKAVGTMKSLRQARVLTRNEQWQFLFEMIYALNREFKAQGFAHNDATSENILYVLEEPRSYTLVDGREIQCQSQFRPLWADFSTATFGNQKHGDDYIIYMDMVGWHDGISDIEHFRTYRPYQDDVNYDRWLIAIAEKFQ